jgi:hypothetical protein
MLAKYLALANGRSAFGTEEFMSTMLSNMAFVGESVLVAIVETAC